MSEKEISRSGKSVANKTQHKKRLNIYEDNNPQQNALVKKQQNECNSSPRASEYYVQKSSTTNNLVTYRNTTTNPSNTSKTKQLDRVFTSPSKVKSIRDQLRTSSVKLYQPAQDRLKLLQVNLKKSQKKPLTKRARQNVDCDVSSSSAEEVKRQKLASTTKVNHVVPTAWPTATTSASAEAVKRQKLASTAKVHHIVPTVWPTATSTTRTEAVKRQKLASTTKVDQVVPTVWPTATTSASAETTKAHHVVPTSSTTSASQRSNASKSITGTGPQAAAVTPKSLMNWGVDIVNTFKSIYKSVSSSNSSASTQSNSETVKRKDQNAEQKNPTSKLNGVKKSSIIFKPSQKQSNVLEKSMAIHDAFKELKTKNYTKLTSNKPYQSANTRLQQLRDNLQNGQQKQQNSSELKFNQTNLSTSIASSHSTYTNDDCEPMDWQSDSETNEQELNCLTVERKRDNIVPHDSNGNDNENVGRFNIVVSNLGRLFANGNSKVKDDWSNQHFYFVLDTNVLLDELEFIKDLSRMRLNGTMGSILCIPYAVLRELDKLKMRTSAVSLKERAIRAINYLNTKFENDSANIRAQSAFEETEHLIAVESADDSIINCCLQMNGVVDKLLLLTNDTNLRNKAFANKIGVSTKSDLISLHVDAFSALTTE